MIKKIISMIGLHGLNFLLPLILLPYLVRTLGVSEYGAMGFAIAVNQYFLLVTEYGFTLSAAREVARSKSDINEVSELFWNVQITKLFFVVASAVCMIVGTIFVTLEDSQKTLIYIGFLIIIAHWLTPSWLYLGKEMMNLLMIFTLIPRIMIIPAMFIFVKSPSDLEIAMYVQVIPGLLTGLISIAYIYKSSWVLIKKPSWEVSIQQLKHGWPLFVSSLSTSIFTSSTPLCLGIVSGSYAVGIFVAADKIRAAAQALITPVSQVIFPRVSALFLNDKRGAYKILRASTLFLGSVNLSLALCLWIFSEPITYFAYANAAPETETVLKILAPCVLATALSSILGANIMIPLGMARKFGKIAMLCGLFHLIILIPLTYFFAQIGASYAVLLTELVLLFVMAIVLVRTTTDLPNLERGQSVLKTLIYGVR